jgi:hypothetical protein
MGDKEKQKRQELISKVLHKLLKDIVNGDFAKAKTLLEKISATNLEIYLGEKDEI